jgi:predicted porin
MQKKALVVAIGAALVIQGAFAQDRKKPEADSVVELYGKVYPEIMFFNSKGATAEGTATCTICLPAQGENAIIKRNEIESSNSRFGIRGHERLGPGLKAIYQLETQFLVDQNNTPFAARDSFVGLAHDTFGTVKLGRFDTPFKEYGDDISHLGVSSGNFTSTSSVYRHIGMGTQNNAARFHERRINAVQYESPDIGPLEFKAQYSTNEAKTATRDPKAWSFGGQVELGPFAILLGHEIHYDLFGLSLNSPSSMRNNNDQAARSRDTASAVALKWKVGNHQFEIDANKKKYHEYGMGSAGGITGRVLRYENKAYMFIWEGRWSPQWRTAFHYVRATEGKCQRASAACNTDGLEGTQISVGAAYHFSRRTYLFFLAQWLRNGYSASFNTTANQDVNPGEDVQQFAVGIHTSF